MTKTEFSNKTIGNNRVSKTVKFDLNKNCIKNVDYYDRALREKPTPFCMEDDYDRKLLALMLASKEKRLINKKNPRFPVYGKTKRPKVARFMPKTIHI